MLPQSRTDDERWITQKRDTHGTPIRLVKQGGLRVEATQKNLICSFSQTEQQNNALRFSLATCHRRRSGSGRVTSHHTFYTISSSRARAASGTVSHVELVCPYFISFFRLGITFFFSDAQERRHRDIQPEKFI